MELKLCNMCGKEKPYDRTAKKDSKASGFKGAVCWGCHIVAQQETRSTPEGREASQEASLKTNRRLVTDPATGEQIRAGALSNRRLVTDPVTGEMVRAGALSTRRLVEDPVTGEMVRAGALSKRKRIREGKHAAYYRTRLANDPMFKLASNTRSLIINSFKAKGWSKKSKTQALIGCSFEEFDAHLGPRPDGVHLDHILPCSRATDEIEFAALQHYTNFQWLPAVENLSKGATLPHNAEERMSELLDLLWHREGGGEISLDEYLEVLPM